MRSQIDYTEHEADELSVGARTSKAVSLAHPELASVPAARGRESRSSRQIALTVCQPKVFFTRSRLSAAVRACFGRAVLAILSEVAVLIAGF